MKEYLASILLPLTPKLRGSTTSVDYGKWSIWTTALHIYIDSGHDLKDKYSVQVTNELGQEVTFEISAGVKRSHGYNRRL